MFYCDLYFLSVVANTGLVVHVSLVKHLMMSHIVSLEEASDRIVVVSLEICGKQNIVTMFNATVAGTSRNHLRSECSNDSRGGSRAGSGSNINEVEWGASNNMKVILK